MAPLNEAAFNEAYDTWERSKSGARDSLRAAICTYLDDAPSARPGPIVELSTADFVPIPQRDYRKEVWIAALSTGNGADWADGVLAHFDKTFPEGTTP